MFSQLGPLFKATFRQTDPADVRLAIPHEEKKDDRRKSDDGSDDDSSALWEDSAGVSVDALRTFLINFLNGSTVQTGLANAAPATPSAPVADTPRPLNTANARAAGAYQSMANRVEPHHYTPPPVIETETPDAPKTDADLLHAGEIRTIHQLIADLDDLDKAGIMVLTIEPAETFLESLTNAVNLAKSTR
jgi:hypothetical protein